MISWTCPICDVRKDVHPNVLRATLFGNVPLWFLERAGPRAMALSHLNEAHLEHGDIQHAEMRRDVMALFSRIREESQRDAEAIEMARRYGWSRLHCPW